MSLLTCEEQIAAILVIAFLGTFAGSLAAYWLGRVGGRRLLLFPGPLLAWRARLLVRSEGFVQRRAFLASLFGPGRPAGIHKLARRPFIAGSALSGLMWTLTTLAIAASTALLPSCATDIGTEAPALVASATFESVYPTKLCPRP